MARTRAVILVAVAACVVIVVLVRAGGDDGPWPFMAADSAGALLVERTRVGDDVSGPLTQARLLAATPVLIGDDTLLREMQQGSNPFTGTVDGERMRLQRDGSALGTRVDGQLDGDALKLISTRDKACGPETVRCDPASREDFQAPTARLRAADAARPLKATTARLRADARAKLEITRVATAYEIGLGPDSPTIRAGTCQGPRNDIITDRTLDASASGCTSLIRLYQRDVAAPPTRVGAAEIDLRTFVAVPGASGGNLADGAELRFAAMPNDPIGLAPQDGKWRIAEYR